MDLLRLVLARQGWDELARLPRLRESQSFYFTRRSVWHCPDGKQFDQCGEPTVESKIPGILLTVRSVFLRDVLLFQRLREAGHELDFWICLASGIPEFQAEALAHSVKNDFWGVIDLSFVPWTPQLIEECLKLHVTEFQKTRSTVYIQLVKMQRNGGSPNGSPMISAASQAPGRDEAVLFLADKDSIDSFSEDFVSTYNNNHGMSVPGIITIGRIKRAMLILKDPATMRKVPPRFQHFYRAICGEVYDDDQFLQQTDFLSVGIPFKKSTQYQRNRGLMGQDGPTGPNQDFKYFSRPDMVFYAPKECETVSVGYADRFALAMAAYRLGYCYNNLPHSSPVKCIRNPVLYGEILARLVSADNAVHHENF